MHDSNGTGPSQPPPTSIEEDIAERAMHKASEADDPLLDEFAEVLSRTLPALEEPQEAIAELHGQRCVGRWMFQLTFGLLEAAKRDAVMDMLAKTALINAIRDIPPSTHVRAAVGEAIDLFKVARQYESMLEAETG